MLTGKIQMILLTAMLAAGTGAGCAFHGSAALQTQAAQEAALEDAKTETTGFSTGSMEKEYIRQYQAEEDLTETLEEKESSGADAEELDALKGQLRNVQLQQQLLKARMEAQG